MGEWVDHVPEVAGAIVGLAAFNAIYLDLRIHPLLYRFLEQGSVSVGPEDLQAVHPTLDRSLRSLQKTDVSSLALSWKVTLPGGNDVFDLSGGTATLDDFIEPTDVDRFISAYALAALVDGMRPQIEGFVKMAVARMSLGASFQLCTASDLELMLCGLTDVGDFHELEGTCVYTNGYSAESPTIKFFWEVVHSMSEIWKRKLLLFCTGCDRVPILGLKALNLVISQSTADLGHLPTANTCINQLNLPVYDSLELTHGRLYASLEHHAGFGFA